MQPKCGIHRSLEITAFVLQMILLDNAEAQKRHYEKKCEDMAQRLRDTERALQNAQKDISNYQVSIAKKNTRIFKTVLFDSSACL